MCNIIQNINLRNPASQNGIKENIRNNSWKKLFIVVRFSVNGMVFSGGILSHLDILFQKSIWYNYHKANYERSLLERIIPMRLKINKQPAFEPVSENFLFQWNNVLFDAEKKLVKLLLEEFRK